MSKNQNTTTIGGYQLLRKLHCSSLSEIYLAKHKGKPEQGHIAFKRILPPFGTQPDKRNLFIDKTKKLMAVSNPYIVQCYEVDSVDNECFSIMEFLDGIDLHSLLTILSDRGKSLPLEISLYIVKETCQGLQFLHENIAFIHEKLSLSNVFLTRDGIVKLTGAATSHMIDSGLSSQTGSSLEQIAHRSPEQCSEEGTLEEQHDIYSLGVILYRLLTGRMPYSANNQSSLCNEIIEGKLIAPSVFMALPHLLERIVLKCLAQNPKERFTSVSEAHEGIDFYYEQAQYDISQKKLATFLSQFPMTRDSIEDMDLPIVTHNQKEKSPFQPLRSRNFARTLVAKEEPTKPRKRISAKETMKAVYEPEADARATQQLPANLLEQLRVEDDTDNKQEEDQSSKNRVPNRVSKPTQKGLQSVSVNLIRRQTFDQQIKPATFVQDTSLENESKLPFEESPPTKEINFTNKTLKDDEGLIRDIIQRIDSEKQ